MAQPTRKKIALHKKLIIARAEFLQKEMEVSPASRAAVFIACGKWLLASGHKLGDFKELYCTT